MGCGRQFCINCREELIHRDHRRWWESSSALGALIRRNGPRDITAGDIDLYTNKYSTRIMRFLEHKLKMQTLGFRQKEALTKLDECVKLGVEAGKLREGSGVFVIRGDLGGEDTHPREVTLQGSQQIELLSGEVILVCESERDLWDWINGSSQWVRRNGISRQEYRESA